MKFNIVKCSDIIDVRDGTHDSPKYVESGYPLVTSKNIKDNKINFDKVNYISQEDFDKINKRSEVENGDILMPMIGTIGNPVLVDEDIKFAIKNVALFKLARNEVVNNKYFYYLLESNHIRRQLQVKKRGGTQSFVSLTNIRELKIPVPDRNVQDKIAQVLDKSKQIINQRKQQIDILNKLIENIFYNKFGHPFLNEKKMKFGKFGSISIINPQKSEIKELNKDINVSFIPMESVGTNGEIDARASETLDSVYSSYTYFKESDVLFAKITPCMENGKGAIARNLINGIGFGSTEFHVIRSKPEESTPEWIYYLTTLEIFRKTAEGKMTGSAGQRRVGTEFLENIKVAIPPIELQNEFAQIVNKIEKEKELLKQSLEQLETNFKALEQKAFNGELFN